MIFFALNQYFLKYFYDCEFGTSNSNIRYFSSYSVKTQFSTFGFKGR